MSALDLKDRQLLYELDLNARQSFNELAKKLRLNKNTVQYRISRLQKLGIIRNFYTLIDTAKLGYLIFRVFLRFQNLAHEREMEIIEYLKSDSRVGWMVSVEGNWDLNFMIWVKTHYEFDEFWREFKFKFEESIVHKWISLFVRLHFYTRPFLANTKNDRQKAIVLYDKVKIPISLDEKDIIILRTLAEDCRTPVVDIAKKASMTVNTAKHRIKRLWNCDIIKSFKAVIDLEKLGYKYYKLHFELKSLTPEDWRSIKTYVQLHPNIWDLNELVNGADLELDLHVKTDAEMRTFISELRARFQNNIRNYEILHYYKEHKLVFFPVTE